MKYNWLKRRFTFFTQLGILPEIVIQVVVVTGQFQQTHYGRPSKFGEQAEMAAEYVAVCKAFQEVQEVTDVRWAKLQQAHHIHYVQVRQDVADQ